MNHCHPIQTVEISDENSYIASGRMEIRNAPMTEIDKKKEELDKAARTINAILRLMHKGAMSHEQARSELLEIAAHADCAEISFCVNEAMKAVEANQKKVQRNTASVATTNGQTEKSVLW
jgi:hypothetical protein